MQGSSICADLDYGTFAEARLRDVPYEVFVAYKDRLPELWCRRAEHFYSEFARAEKGAELWRKGDLEGYGQLGIFGDRSKKHQIKFLLKFYKQVFEMYSRT